MESLKEYISRHRVNKKKADDFVTYLYELMDKYGFDKNSDLYDKANISRQYWSKLINKERQPSLETTLKIVFALKLTNQECKYLLKKAGYTLASSSTYALIIRYCIENKIYDLNKVNDLLEEHGFKAIE
jgi:transcriptional regulator with XRE-family HTH domain